MYNYLTFYGDGQKWDNFLNLTALPSGFSCNRQFRYRDRWIQASLINELRSEDYKHLIYNGTTILAARFQLENSRWLLLPIRKAKITFFDHVDNNYSVFFNYGPMIDFKKYENLYDACKEIKDFERNHITNESLFFRSSEPYFDDNFCEVKDEDSSWVNFVDKLAICQNLPIHENAKSSLFLRVSSSSTNNEFTVSKIFSSKYEGEKSGIILKEGKSYEIKIFHRVPSLINQDKTISDVEFSYGTKSTNIELNKYEEIFSSNYQTHNIVVSAKSKSGAYEILKISPNKRNVKIINDDSEIFLNDLEIAFKVKYSFCYRFSQQGIYILLLWLALFSLSIVELGIDIKNIQPALVINLILSGLASIIIHIAKQRI